MQSDRTTPPKRIWADPPKRIWADPPETFDGMDMWRSEPGGKGVPYILASEVDALVAAPLREAAEDLLVWYTDLEDDRGPHMLVLALIPQPAAAALDKLIAEAVKAETERCAQIGGDAAVEDLLRHEPDASPLEIQMTRKAIANPIRAAKAAP